MGRFIYSIKAAVVHLMISAAIILSIALWVKYVWFPYPYDSILGGLNLFFLMVAVDLICGPLLTLILISQKKTKKALTIDFILIAVIQISALTYGLYSLYLTRPVALVYEVDRFVAVALADIDQRDRKYKNLGIFSPPQIYSIRAPRSGDEALESIEYSLIGIEPSVRPGWWQDYNLGLPLLKERMKPIANIKIANKNAENQVGYISKNMKINLGEIYYLPLVSSSSMEDWSVLLKDNGDIIGFIEMDGF